MISKTQYISLILTVVLLFSFCLTACSRSIDCGESAISQGVTLIASKCTATETKKGITELDTHFSLYNSGDVYLTSLSYNVVVTDSNGAVLYTFKDTFYRSEKAMLNGESTSFSKTFRQVLDGKPSRIQVSITDITDEAESPALHIPVEGEYVYESIDNPYLANIASELPVEVLIVIDHMGALETADIKDTAVIKEIVSAFTNVKFGEETGEFVTDNYNSISFVFADGTKSVISLNLKNLELNRAGKYYSYELDNFTELWTLMNELSEFEN